MDTITIKAKGISVSLDLTVGHIADMTVESGGRRLKPLHRAPWVDANETLPKDLPQGTVRLSGDFLCAPFSRSDVEEAPLHGWTANSAWDVVESGATDGGWRAVFRLRHKVMGAGVDKIFTLIDGHPFLYQEHVFSGGSGAISVAHHPMTVMKGGGKLAFSPKRFAATLADPLEPDPTRGRFMLAYPARSPDLARFPAAGGGTLDLTQYRMEDRREDFVTLVEADHGGPGWTALARQAEDDLVLVLKNPAELPITMLWLSNGGRDYAPWSGRHLGVLGIEDGRAAVGHVASIGDNWLKREGVATAFALGEGHSFSFRHVIGALSLSSGQPPQEITTADGQMRLSAGGSTRDVPFDSAFLRIGQPAAA
ncbi:MULTISPECIES: hypothetical protein [Mesorhizobium]|uniref:DUF4432 family protein n=2 Tax=Mesorhizobium TaxID=68287 RepID=A0A1A5IIG8_RHILI|nr:MULTISPECIES: hypothetical protein [Mesorhizobium]MBE1707661.1 hypothetical protein [Mesorhizobium japonicum]MBE1712785.1 hypothetical protein [Mesorhizobium japonicum]MUT24879.1 hypothetical protein [Mesorhizobium japonicum]MUT31422.1 hypothetical protein [Mesorhizobium japonicum]OBP79004.1 hypothetical protein BAE42_26895 [Mesorhizobium loti]